MDITLKINLDGYFPNEIIDLHQQGIVTLDEIVASGCIHSCFGPKLSDYAYSQQKLLYDQMPDTVAVSRGYDGTRGR